MITEHTNGAPIVARQKKVMTRKRRKMPLERDNWPRVRDTKRENSKGRYVVDLRPHVYGKGSRLYFETLDAATIKAKQLAIEHKNQGTESLDFPTHLRVEAAACHALLKPLGVSLTTAVHHFIKWSRDEKHRNESRLMKDCIAEYLKSREADVASKELSWSAIREIRHRMRQFTEAWGEMPIRAVTRKTLTDFLDGQQAAGMKPLSRVNIRAKMSCLFNYCVEREWIEQSPCVKIKIKVTENEVTILTVDQADALMKPAAASIHAKEMVPYFAVCLFAGLRPTEAQRFGLEPNPLRGRANRDFEAHQQNEAAAVGKD